MRSAPRGRATIRRLATAAAVVAMAATTSLGAARPAAAAPTTTAPPPTGTSTVRPAPTAAVQTGPAPAATGAPTTTTTATNAPTATSGRTPPSTAPPAPTVPADTASTTTTGEPAAPAAALPAATPLTLTVTRSEDDHAPGSLRDAIDQANATAVTDVTILLPAGTYDLTICGPTDDDNTGGDLDLVNPAVALTIEGQGGAATITQTCDGSRVLDDHATALLTVRDVTITGGHELYVVALDLPAIGGGVRSNGAVTLDHATLAGNRVTGGEAHAGALSATGDVTVVDSTVTGNKAIGDDGVADWYGNNQLATDAVAGAVETPGTVTITRSTVSDNEALGGNGYGLAAGGDATAGAIRAGGLVATSSAFERNHAVGGIGGWLVDHMWITYGSPGGTAFGGAAHVDGEVTLTDVTATDNRASGGVGDQEMRNRAGGGVVSATGHVDIHAGSFTRNLTTGSGGSIDADSITADATTVTDGEATDGHGGALHATHDAVVTDSTFRRDHAAEGGAVSAAGVVMVTTSVFDMNQAGSAQQGNFGGAPAGRGGAVQAAGPATVTSSTFTGNQVIWTNPSEICWYLAVCGPNLSQGGAIDGADDVTIVGSTFASNSVTRLPGDGVASGGAVRAGHAVTATNSTFADNASVSDPNGAVPDAAGTIDAASVTLTAVTLSGTQGLSAIRSPQLTTSESVLVLTAGGPTCAAGATTSGGWNWADDASCGTTAPTDHVGTEPTLLLPLAANGGPTPTRLPGVGSPLVDVVPAASCAVADDQRGFARPVGAACDVGSVDTVAGTPPVADLAVTITGPDQVLADQGTDYAVTVTTDVDLNAVVLDLDVPDGWWFWPSAFAVADPGVRCTSSGTQRIVCQWTEGLAAGIPSRIDLSLVSPPVDMDATFVVSVAGTLLDANPANDTARLATHVSSSSDLSPDLRAVHPAWRGEPYAVSIYTSVNGSRAVATADQPLRLHVELPPELPVRSTYAAGWNCSAAPQTLDCTFVGTYPTWGGDEQRVDVVLDIPADRPDGATYPLTASIGGGVTHDPDPTNDVVTFPITVTPSADLTVSALTLTPLGDSNIDVAVTVTNLGPSPAGDLSVALWLPSESSLTDWDAPGMTCAFNQHLLTLDCSTPSALDPGATWTGHATAHVPVSSAQPGYLGVSASTSTHDPQPGNDRVQHLSLPPNAPANVTAVAGRESATVSWEAATVPWGAPPASRYDVTDGNGHSCTWTSGPLTCTVTGLRAATQLWVTASNAFGVSPASGPVPVWPRTGSTYVPVPPRRILDSRTTTGGWSGPLAAGTPRSLDVRAALGGALPATASAVVMNVTVTDGTAGSYLTVSPAGAPGTTGTTTSNINFAAGETIPGLVTVKLGTTGAVTFTNAKGAVAVVADLVGFYAADDLGSRFNPQAPTRVLDSRTTTGGWNGQLVAGAPRDLVVRGAGTGVPDTATAIIANVTVTGADAGSFVSVWPAGLAQPEASNLNFGPQQTIANLVVVGVGTNGAVRFANAKQGVDVVVDVVGYFDPGAGAYFHAIDPSRVLDDRIGVGLAGPWHTGQTRRLKVTTWTSGVPYFATAVAANVTVTNATKGSYLSVFPGDVLASAASTLNFGPGQTIANLAVVRLDAAGGVNIANALGSVDVVADVVGYYAAA